MKRIFWSNLFLFVTSSLLSLFLLELSLRLVEKANGINPALQILQDTAPGGLCNVMPNLRIETKIGNERVLISTNSVGMHWREVAVRKPENIRRIVFVGDSFTFGEWANCVENSFVGVVDSYVSPKDFEVLNFGVPGDGLVQTEVRLQNSILAYNPDYVVLMFFNGNDMRDTYLGVRHIDCTSGHLRRNVVEEKIPAEFRDSWWNAFKAFVDRHSALIRALRTLKAQLTADPNFADSRGNTSITLSTFKVSGRFLVPSFWSQTEYPAIAEQARDETLQVLERIRRLSEKGGAELIIITIPFRDQVYALQENGDDYDIGLPQRYVEEFAKEKNIPYYNLLPPLRAYVATCQDVIYVPDDAHFNTPGHLIVGKLISGFLARMLEISLKDLAPPQCSDETMMSSVVSP